MDSNMKFYTLNELTKKLKELKLPNTRMTMYNYEKQGVIEKPKVRVGNNLRLYSKEEIDVIIDNIIEYGQRKNSRKV